MIRVGLISQSMARASCKLAIVAAAALTGLCGCEGAGVGVSYSMGGYYAPYDYDYDYGYAPWGPDYYVGPPVVVGGVVVHDHDHHHDHDHDHDHEHDRGRSYDGGHDHGGGSGRPAPHYRAPPPSQHAPSIPTRSRPH